MAQGRSNNIIFYSDQEVVDEKLSLSGGPEGEGVLEGVGRVGLSDQRRVVNLEREFFIDNLRVYHRVD